jgi:hypothetical protein
MTLNCKWLALICGIKGTYRMVEGIDDNGNLGSQVYQYKVE